METLSNKQCPPLKESAATRASPSNPSKNNLEGPSSNRSACVHTKHALFRQARPRAKPTATMASRSAVFKREARRHVERREARLSPGTLDGLVRFLRRFSNPQQWRSCLDPHPQTPACPRLLMNHHKRRRSFS